MRGLRSVLGSIERMSSGEELDVVPAPYEVVSSGDLFNLRVEPYVVWDRGEIVLKLKAIAESRRVERLELRRITLDDYLPDLKLPHDAGPVEPGKPKWIKVRFPGFTGRGGKIGKLDLRYSTRSGSEVGGTPTSVTIPLRPGR